MTQDDSPRSHEFLNRVLARLKVEDVPHIKRIIITVVGGTVLVFGVALIFLPGPSVLVIPAGLAILGTEYAWARRWLRNGRAMAAKAMAQTQRIGRAVVPGRPRRQAGARVGEAATAPSGAQTSREVVED